MNIKNIKLRKSQGGFTLIELVVVIVLLAIMAAVALPRFVDLTDDAGGAAVNGVAGAVSAASAINYSTFQVDPTKATALAGAEPCAALIASANTGLIGGTLPAGFTIDTDTTCLAEPSGAVVACVIEHTDTLKQATANIICTG